MKSLSPLQVAVLAVASVATLSYVSVGDSQPTPENSEPVPMVAAADAKTYSVAPGKTLGQAMERQEPLVTKRVSIREEKGNCVRDDLIKKPEGAEDCKCYEHTECKGNESRACKRHCRKDLCMCCSI